MEDIEVATTCLNIYILFHNQIIIVLCLPEYLIDERLSLLSPTYQTLMHF